jgi:nucleotide-binding universal stress UspA family protein
MERLLLGSVAETALKSAPCNVLVVPDAGSVGPAVPDPASA